MAELTPRGRRTRDRIVRAAVELFAERGLTDTSVSDVLQASQTGKSQFYHYFESKADLIREALRFQRLRSLPNRNSDHGHLDSWARIRAWFDRLLELSAESGAGRLDLIGSVPSVLAQDASLQREVVRTAHLRRRLLFRGLRRMKKRGELTDDADPERMASFAAAAIEGGLHLSSTDASTDALGVALDETWARLRSYAVE